MNGRDSVLSLLALGVAAAPLIAEAQQAAKVPRIGFLALNLAATPQVQAAFLQGLRDLGYVEGRNLVIETRDVEGNLERLPAFAAKLVALKVNVIVARIGVLIGRFAAIVRDHSIVLPADLTLMFKALMTMEGLGRHTTRTFTSSST